MALPLFNIGGLASGLDTNSIVSQLMELERIPVRQVEVRRATYEARNAAWDRINTKISELQTAVDKLASRSDWNAFASATSSNEDAVSVSVSGSPTPSIVSFTVDRLAAAHQTISDTDYSSVTDLVGAGTFSLTIDGTQHDITTTATTTLSDLIQDIEDLDVGVTASALAIDSGQVKLVLAAEESGDDSVFTIGGDVGAHSVLQQGQDAQLTLGSGGGSITIERSTNVVDDLIDGTTITLKATTASAVTVNTARDLDQATEAVKAVVDALSAAIATIDKETQTASESSSAAGPLSSDSTARNLKLSLRSYLSGAVPGLTGDYTTGSSVGISLTREGDVTLDETKLRDALAADFKAVASLFSSSYSTSDSRVGVVSAPEGLVSGTYSVVATQAQSSASVTGIRYDKPNPDETFQITVGANTVDVTVPKNAFIDEAIDAINADLLAGGITTVVASQGSVGGDDVLVLTGTEPGSAGSFTVSANTFGLAGTHIGVDVAGTIDGVAGTGSGSRLSAASPLSGLVLSLNITESEVSGAGGSLDLGTVTISSGLAGTFGEFLESVTETGGLIDRATDRWDAQIKLADERIEQLESRLELREITLRRQFTALESTLAQLQGVASQLAAGVQSLGGLQV